MKFYFFCLKIDALCHLWAETEKFNIIHKPDKLQQNKIQTKEKAASDMFNDMLCYKKMPKIR